MNDVSIGSRANSDFKRSEFVNVVMDQLVESEELSGFTPCYYDGIIGSRGRKVEIDGYDFDEYDGTFSVVACRFDGTETPSSRLTKSDIEDVAERARRFVEGSISGEVQQSIEESEDAYGLSMYIYGIRNSIERFRIFVLSDLEKSDRIKTLDVDSIDSKGVVLKLWDISNLYDLSVSHLGREEISIRLKDFGAEPISCIRACKRGGGVDYDAYLCAIPGDILARIYGKFGSRLLESNVRSFLKLTTKTNKAIRGTILKEPEMFFAYNNGITATATDIEVYGDGDGLKISSFMDLQIVNGGQTTVTLYTVGKSKEKPDLSHVYVPMKISVIDPEKAESVVPKISRSANTQNKVSESDFFSNSPFHKQMEQLSRKIRAPQAPGASFSTLWYYERVRGQYQQDINSRSGSDVKKFKLENPKNQVFTKTDLSKFRNSYTMKPHVVSKGAQYSLVEFAKSIDESKMENYNERYYKETIALAIMFRRVQELVTDQPWYNGGYRAQIVTYSISKLSQMVSDIGGTLDLMKIWEMQSLPDAVERQLIRIMACVNDSLINDKEEENVGQWCKKEKCWAIIKSKDVGMLPELAKCLVSKKKESYNTRIAARDQRGTNRMNALIEVVNMGEGYWHEVMEWGLEHSMLDGRSKGLLNAACNLQRKRPSEAQAVAIMKIRDDLRDAGMNR